MKPVSKQQPLSRYQWGGVCEAWVLADTPELSIKQEFMPPHTREALHFHQYAQQFFFITSGKALFEIEGETIEIGEQEGLLIAPGKKHRVRNETENRLEFLITSQPSTQNDRIHCE